MAIEQTPQEKSGQDLDGHVHPTGSGKWKQPGQRAYCCKCRRRLYKSDMRQVSARYYWRKPSYICQSCDNKKSGSPLFPGSAGQLLILVALLFFGSCKAYRINQDRLERRYKQNYLEQHRKKDYSPGNPKPVRHDNRRKH